ncbi:MAG: AAA family ATPase [Verrucomicrobia bacterium]|nr:AAA family ATPase [Verrucomicrobiota bacterium]
MKLQSFGISNFKAFGKEFQTIPIKPITLVFGPNSAGKSSLLHSLLWLNHAESCGETDVFNPSLAGKSVNLGGFDSCLNRKSGMHRLRFTITIENPAPDPDSTRWLDTVSQFKLVFACERTEKNQPPFLIGCDLFADDIKLLTIRKQPSSPSAGFDAEFEWSHPALCLSEDEKSHLESWCGLGPMYEMVSLSFLPTKVFLSQPNDDAPAVLFGGFPKEGIPPELERFAIGKLPAAVGDVFAAFRRSIQEIVFIPPIRVIPDRAMDLQSCELSGWHWLAKHPEICDRINDTLKNLGIDHQVKVRELIPVDTAKETIIWALAQVEAGSDLGSLSDAVENAKSTWASFSYTDRKQWLDRHPALFKKMVDYESDIIVSNNETFDYYEEHPEADKEESVPSWWLTERAEDNAYGPLNDWGGVEDIVVFGNEAARLFISEDQGVRDAIMLALKEPGLDKDLLPGDGHLQLRLYDTKRDV